MQFLINSWHSFRSRYKYLYVCCLPANLQESGVTNMTNVSDQYLHTDALGFHWLLLPIYFLNVLSFASSAAAGITKTGRCSGIDYHAASNVGNRCKYWMGIVRQASGSVRWFQLFIDDVAVCQFCTLFLGLFNELYFSFYVVHQFNST